MRHRPETTREGGDRLDPFEAEALSHVDPLFGTALRLTRNRSDAEDLVQDTYLKAFRAAASFERGTNLKAWLFTILHNTWRNRLRDAGREPVEVDSEAVDRSAVTSPSQFSPEQILLRENLDADLQQALDSLPESFRQAVWLRDVEEFTYAEIAEMLGIPLGYRDVAHRQGRRALFERLTHAAGARNMQVARG